MIEVTEKAAAKLFAYLSENKEDSPIRIAVMKGFGGPYLGLAPDEHKDGDFAYVNEDLTLVVDQELSESYGKVTVDYREPTCGCGCSSGGFAIASAKPLANNESDCGSSCSSGGCDC
jgi:Fe-S cluster assembly iron-binding protein IscA